MRDITALIEMCRGLGATLTPLEGRLKIQAPSPLPEDIIAELRLAKNEILTELRYRLRKESECWLLEEWRRISIPEWRRILRESIESGDRKREDYARWMLADILQDPDV
jgi:hypothetical protein